MPQTHAESSQPPSLVVPDSQYPWWITGAPAWARPYLLLARLDRPIGTWLLLLPCWWGTALGALYEGDGLPNFWHMTLFALGALIMRSAGCAFNDLVDKDLDAKVARTRIRPVASGQISRTHAFVFAAALSLLGLLVLVQFNALTIWLGVFSVAIVAAYPFMKRITHWPQAWLGLAFNYGALLGFTAASNTLTWPALWLYLAGLAWTLGYDTIYACQDVEDDALVGVKSTARLFGPDVALLVSRFFAVQMLLLVSALWTAGAPLMWSALLCAPAALLLAQQTRSLRAPQPDYLALFRGHRSIGFIVFAIICILSL
ncbi:MAG: 4-hydroxybenzoate octaprenyltransferase [Pseudomonadota bacterium]